MPDLTIVIAEDDQYSCDLMSLLITRDWRTEVAAEGIESLHGLDNGDPKILHADLILLDTEIPDQPDWPLELMGKLRRWGTRTKVLCTGTSASLPVLHKMLAAGGHGYVIKDEVHYALAETAVCMAAGYWVCTPSVAGLIRRHDLTIPEPLLVVNGLRNLERFEGRELAIARLAIIFNQRPDDIAEELNLSRGHIRDLISRVYSKLGVNDILDGRVPPEEYFTDPEILGLFHKAISLRKSNPNSTKYLKTLAFHLLTLAEIEE